TRTPSTLALTRQNLPTLRTEHTAENLTARGAYELAGAEGEAKATIFASGSEVEIALAANVELDKRGISARVVSVPSFELFSEQDEAYGSATISNAPIKIAVEAGIRLGWDAIIGSDGLFVGMSGLGASAPIDALYKHFSITAEAVVDAVEGRLNK